MGYRSDVLFVLKKDPKLAEELGRYELWISNEGAGSVESRLGFIFQDKSEEEEWFEWFQGCTKWYSGAGFPDVDWLEALMDWLDSQDLEEYYQFIVLGENLDDNVTRGFYDAYIITRKLERC